MQVLALGVVAPVEQTLRAIEGALLDRTVALPTSAAWRGAKLVLCTASTDPINSRKGFRHILPAQSLRVALLGRLVRLLAHKALAVEGRNGLSQPRVGDRLVVRNEAHLRHPIEHIASGAALLQGGRRKAVATL